MPDLPPIVLVFAATDPSGGAGLQADIMTLSSMGCHPLSCVTAITIQDTMGVEDVMPIDPEWVADQARAVLEDMPVAAFKIGMLGSIEAIAFIAEVVSDYPDIPLILDPVLASGRGDALAADEMVRAYAYHCWYPRPRSSSPIAWKRGGWPPTMATTMTTPTLAAQELLSRGCEYVLVTGTHEPTTEVVNRLYGNRRLLESFHWERLPHSYHGSGCTLAAACAATIAHGFDPIEAVAEAQDFTWHSLLHANRLGMGQHLPDRLFWARDEDEPDDEPHRTIEIAPSRRLRGTGFPGSMPSHPMMTTPADS